VLASARAENAAAASALAAAAADAGNRLQAALRESNNPGDLREQVLQGGCHWCGLIVPSSALSAGQITQVSNVWPT
jgi:hypothetical protein